MQDYAIETFNLSKRFGIKPLEEWKGWEDQLTHLIKERLQKKGKNGKRETTAVDCVNTKVKRGEFFGLLGPNGAGKTTLIKLLTCLLYPDEGTALVNGFDIRKEGDKVRASMNVIISGGWLGFNFALTVQQNLEFFARIYGLQKDLAKERVAEVLDILDLKDKRTEVPLYLSSGMRQKLLLGKAFLVRAPVLFLDEPTIGLDPRAAYDVRDFVKNKLNREYGITVLMSTHYMEEADLLCDRVAIMHEGKIVATDTPEDLKSSVKKGDLLELKVANMTPDLAEKIKGLDGIDDVVMHITDPVSGVGTVRVRTPNGRKILADVSKTIEEEGASVKFVNNVDPTLEDVFINFTGKRLRE